MDLKKFEIVKVDTFADLIKKGLKIHNIVAIDFTSLLLYMPIMLVIDVSRMSNSSSLLTRLKGRKFCQNWCGDALL